MKSICLVVLVAFMAYSVTPQTIFKPPTQVNEYLNPYAYSSGCCPFRYTYEFYQNDPKNFWHLWQNNEYFNPYLNCLCTHWVVALDKSGSMSSPLWYGTPAPTFWAASKVILGDIYDWLAPRPFHFSSFYTFDSVAQLPYYLHTDAVEDQATDALGTLNPFGGTNFNNALLRAIGII